MIVNKYLDDFAANRIYKETGEKILRNGNFSLLLNCSFLPVSGSVKIRLLDNFEYIGFKRKDTSYYNGIGGTPQPLTPTNYVTFNNEGTLIAVGLASDFFSVNIAGVNFGYASLLDWLRFNNVYFEKMKITCTNVAQRNENFTPIKYNPILGSQSYPEIIASNFINPLNVNPDLIEVPLNFFSKDFVSLDYKFISAATTVKIDFFVKI
jgi:hypothetical protein